jgi:beta-lactamase class A
MKTRFILNCIVIVFFSNHCFAQLSPPNNISLVLKKSIEQRLSTVKGDFAVVCKDLQSNEILLINEKANFHAASTMKLAVMVEIFRQADRGIISLQDSVLVKNEFKSIVDGSIYSLDITDDSADDIYKRIDTKMTIYELVYQMITVSSNLATNILIEIADAGKIAKTLKKMGIKDMKVLRGVEDKKAFDKGLNNSVTAYDLMLLLEKIDERKAASDSACNQMLDILFAQKFNDIIPAQLPKDVKVAHKTGSITGVQHDAGIVYMPNGKKYVLVLLSKNLKDTTAAIKVLADISKWIFEKEFETER